MNILAAIDFSDMSSKILDQVKTLAASLSAKVWLLHVAEPEPGFMNYTGGYADYGAGFVDYGPDPKTRRREIAENFRKEHRDLQKEATKLRSAGIETTALLIQGVSPKVILQEAKALAIDLIVIGSHGHGAMYHLLLGSISTAVLKDAPCPVLVIPAHQGGKKN